MGHKHLGSLGGRCTCFGIQDSTTLLPSVSTIAQGMYNSVASRLQALVYSIFPPKEERCQKVGHGACGQYHENSILLWSFLFPVPLYVISKVNVTDSVRLTTDSVRPVASKVHLATVIFVSSAIVCCWLSLR